MTGALAAAGAAQLFPVSAASYLGGLPDAYLRPACGAEAEARGRANTAQPGYLSAMWNPAAPGALAMGEKRIALGGGYRALGRAEGNASFDFRILSRLGMGIAALYRGDPGIEIRDWEENSVGRGSYTTLTAKIALACPITRRLAAGVGIGLFYQNLPASYWAEDADVGYAWTFAVGGIDLGLRWQLRDFLTLALVVQNVNVPADWQFETWGSLDRATTGSLPPTVTAAAMMKKKLAGKPFLWTIDLKSWLFDGDFRILSRPTALVNNGFEWQRWDILWLRAGLSELAIDGDLASDAQTYFRNFSLGIGLGARLDLARIARGLKIDYSLSINKAWAGVDQQVDLVYGIK